MLQDMRLSAMPHQLQQREDAEPVQAFPMTESEAVAIFDFTLMRQELLVTTENAEAGQQVKTKRLNSQAYFACMQVVVLWVSCFGDWTR